MEAAEETRPGRIFLHAYIVTALNPKGIIFFIAFLPQFLDTSHPIVPQMLLFEATFLVLAITNASLYALMAAAARQTIRKPGGPAPGEPDRRLAADRRGPSGDRLAPRQGLAAAPWVQRRGLSGQAHFSAVDQRRAQAPDAVDEKAQRQPMPIRPVGAPTLQRGDDQHPHQRRKDAAEEEGCP